MNNSDALWAQASGPLQALNSSLRKSFVRAGRGHKQDLLQFLTWRKGVFQHHVVSVRLQSYVRLCESSRDPWTGRSQTFSECLWVEGPQSGAAKISVIPLSSHGSVIHQRNPTHLPHTINTKRVSLTLTMPVCDDNKIQKEFGVDKICWFVFKLS